MNPMFRMVALALPMVLLAACGGVSDGGDNYSAAIPAVNQSFPYPVDTATARTTAGGDIPTVRTSTQLSSIADGISRAANTLLATDFALYTGATLTEHDTTCSGGRCTASVAMSGETSEVELNITAPTFGNHPGYSFVASPVMTKRGVQTVQAVSRSPAQETRRTQLTYAGWLDGSIFGISTLRSERGEQVINRIGTGISVGSVSGSNPTGTGAARWEGLMIGGTKEGVAHVIQGDAVIDIDNLMEPDVDIRFSSTFNLNTGEFIRDMTWTDLDVTDGRFSSTDNGEIEGSFYGTTHQEVGGVFDRAGFVGGFGAERVQVPQ